MALSNILAKGLIPKGNRKTIDVFLKEVNPKVSPKNITNSDVDTYYTSTPSLREAKYGSDDLKKIKTKEIAEEYMDNTNHVTTINKRSKRVKSKDGKPLIVSPNTQPNSFNNMAKKYSDYVAKELGVSKDQASVMLSKGYKPAIETLVKNRKLDHLNPELVISTNDGLVHLSDFKEANIGKLGDKAKMRPFDPVYGDLTKEHPIQQALSGALNKGLYTRQEVRDNLVKWVPKGSIPEPQRAWILRELDNIPNSELDLEGFLYQKFKQIPQGLGPTPTPETISSLASKIAIGAAATAVAFNSSAANFSQEDIDLAKQKLASGKLTPEQLFDANTKELSKEDAIHMSLRVYKDNIDSALARGKTKEQVVESLQNNGILPPGNLAPEVLDVINSNLVEDKIPEVPLLDANADNQSVEEDIAKVSEGMVNLPRSDKLDKITLGTYNNPILNDLNAVSSVPIVETLKAALIPLGINVTGISDAEAIDAYNIMVTDRKVNLVNKLKANSKYENVQLNKYGDIEVLNPETGQWMVQSDDIVAGIWQDTKDTRWELTGDLAAATAGGWAAKKVIGTLGKLGVYGKLAAAAAVGGAAYAAGGIGAYHGSKQDTMRRMRTLQISASLANLEQRAEEAGASSAILGLLGAGVFKLAGKTIRASKMFIRDGGALMDIVQNKKLTMPEKSKKISELMKAQGHSDSKIKKAIRDLNKNVWNKATGNPAADALSYYVSKAYLKSTNFVRPSPINAYNLLLEKTEKTPLQLAKIVMQYEQDHGVPLLSARTKRLIKKGSTRPIVDKGEIVNAMKVATELLPSKLKAYIDDGAKLYSNEQLAMKVAKVSNDFSKLTVNKQVLSNNPANIPDRNVLDSVMQQLEVNKQNVVAARENIDALAASLNLPEIPFNRDKFSELLAKAINTSAVGKSLKGPQVASTLAEHFELTKFITNNELTTPVELLDLHKRINALKAVSPNKRIGEQLEKLKELVIHKIQKGAIHDNHVNRTEGKLFVRAFKKNLKDYSEMKALEDSQLSKLLTSEDKVVLDKVLDEILDSSTKQQAGSFAKLASKLNKPTKVRLQNHLVNRIVSKNTSEVQGEAILDFGKIAEQLGNVAFQEQKFVTLVDIARGFASTLPEPETLYAASKGAIQRENSLIFSTSVQSMIHMKVLRSVWAAIDKRSSLPFTNKNNRATAALVTYLGKKVLTDPLDAKPFNKLLALFPEDEALKAALKELKINYATKQTRIQTQNSEFLPSDDHPTLGELHTINTPTTATTGKFDVTTTHRGKGVVAYVDRKEAAQIKNKLSAKLGITTSKTRYSMIADDSDIETIMGRPITEEMFATKASQEAVHTILKYNGRIGMMLAPNKVLLFDSDSSKYIK